MEMQDRTINIIIGDITLSAGTERAVTNLSNNFSSNGHKVRIISIYSKEGSPYYELNENIEVIHHDADLRSNIVLRFYDYLDLAKNIKKYFSSGEVIIGTTHALNCMITFLPKNKGYKLIGCEHMGYWATTKSTRILRKLRYPKLDAVVLLTQDDKIEYEKHISSIKLCEVIPNQFSFFPETNNLKRKKQVLAVGRLEMQKGFDILLNDLHDLIKANSDWTFKIIGNGSMQAELLNLIEKHQLTNVLVATPTSQIENEFLESSIYLMTSRHEGLPMVLLEAKACGLPIVSYNCPTGPKDLIFKNDGFLVEMGNNRELSKSLQKLIDSESLRNEMGANARVNVNEFSPKKVYKFWENLLFKV